MPLNNGRTTCWNTPPNIRWTPLWYLTSVRGAEAFHLYIWMLKDLSWGSDWFYCGYIFSGAAVCWSLLLLVRACHWRNLPEAWTGVAQLGWLVGNTLWCTGELEDNQYPSRAPIYAMRQHQAGAVLIAALVWLSSYHLIVRPSALTALQPSPESVAEYNDSGLVPSPALSRLGFRSWRELELLHLFFWLGKDTAWNLDLPAMWGGFAIPTVLLALDFCVKTLFLEGMVVEHAHMAAQLLWVAANLVWAAGELFHTDNDIAAPLLSPPTPVTLRWVSVLLLYLAFLPLIALHAHWLLCTYSGLIVVHVDAKSAHDTIVSSEYVAVNPLFVEEKEMPTAS